MCTESIWVCRVTGTVKRPPNTSHLVFFIGPCVPVIKPIHHHKLEEKTSSTPKSASESATGSCTSGDLLSKQFNSRYPKVRLAREGVCKGVWRISLSLLLFRFKKRCTCCWRHGRSVMPAPVFTFFGLCGGNACKCLPYHRYSSMYCSVQLNHATGNNIIIWLLRTIIWPLKQSHGWCHGSRVNVKQPAHKAYRKLVNTHWAQTTEQKKDGKNKKNT